MVTAKTVYAHMLAVMEESQKLNESLAATVKRMDSIRTPVADAAQILAVERGYGLGVVRVDDPLKELARLYLRDYWTYKPVFAIDANPATHASEKQKFELSASAVVTVQALNGRFTVAAYRCGIKVAEGSLNGSILGGKEVELKISVPDGFDSLRVSCDTVAAYNIERVAL